MALYINLTNSSIFKLTNYRVGQLANKRLAKWLNILLRFLSHNKNTAKIGKSSISFKSRKLLGPTRLINFYYKIPPFLIKKNSANSFSARMAEITQAITYMMSG